MMLKKVEMILWGFQCRPILKILYLDKICENFCSTYLYPKYNIHTKNDVALDKLEKLKFFLDSLQLFTYYLYCKNYLYNYRTFILNISYTIETYSIKCRYIIMSMHRYT